MSEQETTQQTPEAVPAGLTVQDLALVLQIIQATTSRGAYKPDELTVVGGLYDRVFKFLDSIGALTRTEAPASEATTETPAE